MVHGAVRSLFQLLGAALAGLLILVPLVAWRLSSGPVSLEFLTPYIETALTSKDGSVSVRLDSTVLDRGEGDRMLEFHVRNVRAYVSGNDNPIASIPDMALTLSGRALLHGVLAPNSIRLYGPRLHLVRDASGVFQLGIGGTGSDTDTDAGLVIAQIKDALLGAPDPAKPGRSLQSFAIRNADILIEDRGKGTNWHAPDAELIVRRVTAGIRATGKLPLDLAGEIGRITLDATYAKSDGAVDAEMRLTAIRPAVLARFGGPAVHLGVVDMPLAGSVRVRFGGDGILDTLAFDLAGGAGKLELPAPFNSTHPVISAMLRGELGKGMTRLDLTEARLDLGGPTLSLAAVVDGMGGETSIKAEGALRDVPVDQVHELWPNGLAQNARDWVIPNLSKGMVREATILLSARSPSGHFDDVIVDHLGGEIRPDGVTVDYLHPMPVAHNTLGVCTFDTNSFRIALNGGEVYGLRLKEGSIVFTGLDKDDQFADIELVIAGPATDALKLIDNPPLRYARALGIDPSKVGGDALAKVRLKFPLLKSLRLDDVGIKAHATVKNVSIPKVMMGLDLSDGILDLDVDAKGLDATGPVVLATIPGQLSWRENFSKGTAFRSRYYLKAPAVTEDQRKLLGLDGVPFVAPFIAGPVGAEVTATFSDGGKGEIDAKVDLAASRMELPGLGWVKAVDKPGSAEVLVKLDRRLIASVPRFAVTSGDMDVRGSVAFSPEGLARKVDFSRLIYARTNGEGSIAIRPDKAGLDIVFKGASFDAEPLISRDESAKAGQKKDETDKPPAMSVSANAKSMWVSEKGALTNASATLQRDAEDWRQIHVKGGLGAGKSFTASLQQQAGARRRNFTASSDDAGAVMRTFDIYGDLMGGDLSIDGHIDDSRKDQPYLGTIKVSDYHVRNAPVLARLLTVAALTGVLDVLQGEGVSFSSLEAPFVLTDGLVTVHDVRAWGPALGLTAKGQIDIDHSRMAMEGTVVPAYALNSVLGNIPVLGWLVTGGEKGGGIIAFNYSMKGPTDNPSVTVNPLSALTPGFLRNLFNIFDDGSETDARKGTGAK
ncbi:MAG: AsmA-like C-terminal domain-containing protein [Magnetospirillum sp.]|nr:AsmA-like C-terminal domain-containing protein [Magnetospirillum sp.]